MKEDSRNPIVLCRSEACQIKRDCARFLYPFEDSGGGYIYVVDIWDKYVKHKDKYSKEDCKFSL